MSGVADPAARIDPDSIRQAILDLTAARGPVASICPSEAARACMAGPTWQGLMGPVRAAAVALALEGRIEILRKGKPVDPRAFKGVYRLRIAGPAQT
jgi:hypothetical protein